MTFDPPSSHTLSRVLERLRDGERGTDPDLGRQLDDAFGKHETSLRRYCRRELRGFSEQQVEDAVQDVFEIAWRKMPEYRVEGRFRTFLWAIASRRCAGIRRKRRDVLTEDGFLTDPEHRTERSALGRLVDEERDALLEEASANVLDARQRELIQLRWVLDYPQEDVARMLGLQTKDEVRVALQTCKRRMV
jgi:RNA polymerase sigma factor (sigma-70 family)